MEDIIIYACREHVEIAIDDFVNDMEAAPQITEKRHTKNASGTDPT